MIDLEVIQTAFNDWIANSIAFMPRLVTALLLLLIGWGLARIISSLVRRVGERVGLEGLFQRTGIRAGLDRAEIKRSAPDLLGVFIYWIIFLNVLMIALTQLGLSEVVEPLARLIAFLPQLLLALATLTGGVLLAQFLGKAAQAAMSGMGVDFHEEVGQGVNILLIIMVVIVVLEQLGIDATILTTVFTSVITIVVAGVALAFGLGGRDVARNILAGYYAREQFEPGDTVLIGGEEGMLEGIGTLNAEIRVGDDLLVVPNTRLTGTAVKIREIGRGEQPHQLNE